MRTMEDDPDIMMEDDLGIIKQFIVFLGLKIISNKFPISETFWLYLRRLPLYLSHLRGSRRISIIKLPFQNLQEADAMPSNKCEMIVSTNTQG